MSYQNKVVVITGASEGIGRALADRYSRAGANVVLAARNKDRLESLAGECQKQGVKTLVVPTDVSQKDQCKNLITKTTEHFGKIDILINNAGMTHWAKFEDTTKDDLEEHLMQINFHSAVNCTRYALPYITQSRGQIIAVASVACLFGVPGHAAYAATKHAMLGFFDSLRLEMSPKGVGVTVVAPDFVRTEIHKRGLGPDGNPMGKKITEGQSISADQCAEMIYKAAHKRSPLMITSNRGKMGYRIKTLAPKVLDYFTLKNVERSHLL